MSKLSEFLGALAASVARARQQADEETIAVAELYRDNPLLKGLTVPRLRIPELTIEMPFLVEGIIGQKRPTYNDPAQMAEELTSHLLRIAKEEELDIPDEMPGNFYDELSARLESAIKNLKGGIGFGRESLVKEADIVLNEIVTKHRLQLSPAQTKWLHDGVRTKTRELAYTDPGEPAFLEVGTNTGEVKDKGGAKSVARLRITIREEGLEWTTIDNEDGTSDELLVTE